MSRINTAIFATTLSLAAVGVQPTITTQGFEISVATQAYACKQTIWNPCALPDTTYDGGDQDVDGVLDSACLPEIIRRAITLKNGSYAYVVALVNGKSHQKVRTVRNKPCWTQQDVAPGTMMAVYVTCKQYTGWVGWKVPSGGGAGTMTKQGWRWQPKWM